VNGEEKPIRIGVSSCLLGSPVRFDAGHKRDAFLTDTLGPFVEWVAVCPEVELGLGVPRKTLHLAREGDALRLVEKGTGRDLTTAMRRFAARRSRELGRLELCGYVLKSRSPSCGLRAVPVHDGDGRETGAGSGLFAAALVHGLPEMPLAEEQELEDPASLTQFLRRAFFYRRWQQRQEALVDFHRRHRALLLASGAAATRRLDRQLAAAGGEVESLAQRYGSTALRILRHLPSRRCHARNLGWVVGHLVVQVGDRQRRRNVEAYRAFARGELSWSEAASLLRHSAEEVAHAGVLESAYLFPEPAEWELLVRLDRLQTPDCAPVN
jgi:uncharacterized protein YbbK (DUF523 family)/uncharacterized protein YbgA (DUF1722 family)